MKVKKLLSMLNKEDLNKEILISSDEEMNRLYADGEIVEINDKTLAIIGYSGTEVDI